MHQLLHDFAKMALMKIFAFPCATVCDLYCDGGLDIEKWIDAQIGHYVGFDSSFSSISELHETWDNGMKPYSVDFFELDPSSEDFKEQLNDKGISADIVCCMHHLQSCFETEETARNLLNNVSSLLKPGGYFVGIIPDSSMIWAKYQKVLEAALNKGIGMKVSTSSIRQENYTINFEVEEEKFPFFGKKYQLKFATDTKFESHCLVHFPSLIRLAREAGLEYVEIQNLTEFYDDNRAQFAPMLSSYGTGLLDPRGKLLARTYEVLGLYSTFVFQKPDMDAEPPVFSPECADDDYGEEWEDDGNDYGETVAPPEPEKSSIPEHEKGILGPCPVLRPPSIM